MFAVLNSAFTTTGRANASSCVFISANQDNVIHPTETQNLELLFEEGTSSATLEGAFRLVVREWTRSRDPVPQQLWMIARIATPSWTETGVRYLHEVHFTEPLVALGMPHPPFPGTTASDRSQSIRPQFLPRLNIQMGICRSCFRGSCSPHPVARQDTSSPISGWGSPHDHRQEQGRRHRNTP